MARRKLCQLKGCTSPILRIAGQCAFCQDQFCANHRLPENHECTNLGDCRQQAFDRNKAKLESERTVAAKMAMA